MKPIALDQVVHLPDGRRLGYAEYGTPEGRPVLFFHGTPGSRRQVHADMDEMAKVVGIRLIAPERPGYGLSDPQPGRHVRDWTSDVVALTDALEIDHFSIVGFSNGGSYALACAHDLPKRVERLSLIGCLAPMGGTDVMKSMSPQLSGIFALARSDRAELSNALAPLAHSANGLLAAMAETLPEKDRNILLQRAEGYLADFSEVLCDGMEGIISDFVLAAHPWGISLSDIETEVHIWQGALDCNAPPAMGDYLATVLSKHKLFMLPNEGHLALFTHWSKILAHLLR